MHESLLQIEDPQDYFSGIGETQLATPQSIIIFLRRTKQALQQEALKNRSHHRFVLVVNLATEGQFHVDNLVLSFKPQQALLLLPYQFHHFSQLGDAHLRWLCCSFEFDPLQTLEPLRNRVVDFSPHTSRRLQQLLEEWHQPPSSLQARQVQTALLHVLLSLEQDLQTAVPNVPPEPKDGLLRNINRLLAECQGRTITVNDLARALNRSGSRLRTRFKEVAGLSLGSYIRNYRLNRAMALLRTTDFPIADIAEMAGYGSPQAFCRGFKAFTGQTPRNYRKPAASG